MGRYEKHRINKDSMFTEKLFIHLPCERSKDLFYSNAEPSPSCRFFFKKLLIMSVNKEVKKITTNTLLRMKLVGEKISMITAYDYSFAKIFDEAGIDIILVGDSASNVMAGHETTLPITLEQMIYHASSVVRGCNRSLIIVDLAFWKLPGQ